MKVRLPIFDLGAWAYDWLTSQPIWREQIAKVLDHVDGPVSRCRVLDLGCGPGVSTFVLAERLGPASHVVGIDNAKLMISRARAWHERAFAHLDNIELAVEDATRLPYDDASFDLAVGHSFLYLVPDRVGVLREVRRVLKPNGTLVLMEPSRDGDLVIAARQAWAVNGAAEVSLVSRARFVTSMLLWRVASAAAGRMEPALVTRLFTEAGFASANCHPTLAGLGLHCVGRPEV